MRRKWRWVSRDAIDPGRDVSEVIEIWVMAGRPRISKTPGRGCGEFYCPSGKNYSIVIPLKEFCEMCGIKIKRGECVKVEFFGRVVT